MPVSETAAWARAVASAPAEAALIGTVEINHPAFIENGQQVPVRICADVVDRQFRIEPGAQFNAGQDVMFIAAPFQFDPPKKGQDGAFEAKVRISNVGREISKYLDASVAIAAEATVTLRVYSSITPQVVAQGPYRYVLSEVDETDGEVSATIRVADPANAKFGRLVYDQKNYPALLAFS